MSTWEVLARHDDEGTTVRVFVGGELNDTWRHHSEDSGTWRDGLPRNARITESWETEL